MTGQDTTPTVVERAQTMLAGGERDDPTLPEDERELREIRGALRRAGLTEAQLAGRLGWGNWTTGARLSGQQPTDRRDRFQMACAVVEMIADREAAQADEGGQP